MVRLRARTDRNQAAIVDALRAIGCSVHCTHQLGGGYPDLCVGFGGRTFLLEIKMPGAPLTPDEVKWHMEWRGQVAVVESADDAIDVVTGGW